MMRDSTWPVKLNRFMRDRHHVPFSWGSNDCVLFAADGIKAITGKDLAEKFRGKYRSLSGALKILKAEGGTLAGLADDRLERIPVTLAQRGDLVLHKQQGPFDGALGLVYLGGVQAAFVGEEGIKLIPLNSCSAAWRV